MVDKSNCDHVLKLADCYQIDSVIHQVQDFLIKTDTMTIAQKLARAEQYDLGAVKVMHRLLFYILSKNGIIL